MTAENPEPEPTSKAAAQPTTAAAQGEAPVPVALPVAEAASEPPGVEAGEARAPVGETVQAAPHAGPAASSPPLLPEELGSAQPRAHQALELSTAPTPSATRLLMGASLWTYGALLWAYVVMGEWVLGAKLPEVLGLGVVLMSFGLAWSASVRDARRAGADRWKLVTPGVTGLVLFALTIALASLLFASSRRGSVAATTVGLWLFAAAVYAAGRVLTARRKAKLSGWQLARSIALWVLSGLVTLVSMLAALSRA